METTERQRRGVLLGRDREVEELERTLDRVGSGLPWVIQLSGEPGIGKSRLLDELAQRAETREYLVLDGQAAEFELDVPFGLVIDALNDYAGGVQPAVLRTLDEGAVEELAAILPSLSALGSGQRSVPSGSERYRVHYAVRALLERLARSQPVLLALDDLHWADAASLEVIAHLLRRFQGPLLTALAFRRAPRQLAIALENVMRSGSATRLQPAALTEAEARQLIDPSRGPATCAALYRESGGNPFYLEQLARGDLPSNPRAPRRAPEPGGSSPVPQSVMAAIEHELDGLSRDARRALEAAAVAGDAFESELAGAIAELSERSTLEALDELLEADLIRPTPAPRRFRFRHPIVRRAVYDRVPRGARLGAHARAAKALEAAGVPASARAHHIERSATPGDQQAIAELVDAAHEVVGRAPLAAGRWLAAAAALLSARDAPARRARLLSEAGSAFTSAGAYEDSLASLQEALSLVSVGQIDARADLVAKLAYAKRRSGRPFDSRHLVEAALGSLPSDSPAAPSLRHELAFDQLWHDEFDATRHQAQELLRSGYAQCDQALVCIAATLMSLADSSEDRLEQARANLSEARDACGGLTDEQLAERIYLAFYLGVSALRLEHADEALAFVYRGIDIARSTGQEATTTPWLAIAAQALLLKGRVSEASRVAATAIDDALLTANDWRTIWALEADALANYTAGDPTRALSSANEMLTRAERTHPFLTDHARIQLAGALYAAGYPARALTELAALDTRPRSWLLNLHAGHGWDVPIHAYLALGEVEPARERAACASANAAARGLPQQTASARCAEAAVLLECRDPEGATRAASEAVAIAASAGNPVLSARGQASVGAALAATGDKQGGIAELEQAEQALSACGARRYADIAAQQLRHLGQRVPRRSRRSTGPGLAELSPREREVADQVAKGKTNREIAGTLFLSDKTIETHLAHIYAKLGVKSRATLAALIAREEQSLEI